MIQPGEGVEPFHISYSGVCLGHARQLFEQARVKGRLGEFIRAGRGVHARMQWVPMDFGEPTCEFGEMGLQEYVGTVPPFVVAYNVDETRRIVYVTRPFKLLPNSGL